MEIEIKQMDQTGNGIGFIDNKIVFVSKAITGDIVDIKIDQDKKNYSKAHINKIIKPSLKRIPSLCPFFDKCGGCQLFNMSYDDTLTYKKDRIANILKPLNLKVDVELISNKEEINYRNKIELKIKNSKIGFYENDSNDLVEIDNCLITKKCINAFLNELKEMHIKDGEVTIRCNYNDELLVIINTKDDIKIKDDYSSYKVVGIILNNETIYGENFFMDMINGYFFKVSYDAFFQVNSYINSKLFHIIEDNVKGKKVLDLYSGVGTLSIASSKTADTIYGIEVIPNAVLDAIQNAKMNNVKNINFLMGKVEDKIALIKDDIDTVIIDPPRKGLDNKTREFILDSNYKNIIYISCEAQNLVKDLKELLNKYIVKKIYILDMFSYTYHCECVTILERR